MVQCYVCISASHFCGHGHPLSFPSPSLSALSLTLRPSFPLLPHPFPLPVHNIQLEGMGSDVNSPAGAGTAWLPD